MIFEIVYLSNCGFIILNYVRMETIIRKGKKTHKRKKSYHMAQHM